MICLSLFDLFHLASTSSFEKSRILIAKVYCCFLFPKLGVSFNSFMVIVLWRVKLQDKEFFSLFTDNKTSLFL